MNINIFGYTWYWIRIKISVISLSGSLLDRSNTLLGDKSQSPVWHHKKLVKQVKTSKKKKKKGVHWQASTQIIDWVVG